MAIDQLRKRIILGLCSLALGILFCGSAALAQKKGSGGPVPPGTIYFLQEGSAWSMKGDGSSKAPSVAGQPTYQQHDGSRWFLQYEWGPGDWDGDWGQWFIVSETGASIQLTNEPDLHFNGVPPAWARDDSFFSYCGVYETDEEWIGRLFVVEIAWIDGAPVAGLPTVVFEIRRPLVDEETGIFGYDEVNLQRQDWSPAGDEVVLARWVSGEGLVLDILVFSEEGVAIRRLATGAANAEWSADGGRIAFNREQYSGSRTIQEIWTINPDGTDAVRLTQYASTNNGETGQFHPSWSPDGAYLAYTQRVIKGDKTTYNILRVPSAGGSATSLTSDGASTWPRWRP